MIGTRKKIAFRLIFLILLVLPVFATCQERVDVNKMQLANRYYQEHEFEKASILYKEIFEQSGSSHYFDSYLNCLIGLSDFDTAEKAIKRQLRRTSNGANLLVQWGYLYKLQSRVDDANHKYQEALNTAKNNKSDLIQLASSFNTRREFEWAEKVYLQGRSNLGNEDFNYELARVYLYQRNYERMLEEYLQVIRKDENSLSRVQGSIRSALRSDVDNSLHDLFRTILLKKIQADPGVIAYNRLLVWFFVQEEMFAQALRQVIALDKRTGQEDLSISSLAQMAGTNKAYREALQAYDYLIDKGVTGGQHVEARFQKMRLLYHQFTEKNEFALSEEILESRFIKTFNEIGYTSESASLVQDYAHFLAFYQDKPDEAIQLLKKGMQVPRIEGIQREFLKNEMADIYVYKNDLWEAVLLYSQIIETNRDNSLGDEVKLKKARLGYFMGNISWAQAQLDVIKASTSKLVANDALELSIFISNNTSLDTTEIPMQLFARADLYAFRNQGEKSWAVLDSIEQQYNYNSLMDDVYLRKAKVKMGQGNYEEAVTYLEKITTEYAFDLLGDDALFLQAKIYEQHLNQKEKASELYKNMLVQYPGSVFVAESRERFRKLRGDFEEDEENKPLEGENVN